MCRLEGPAVWNQLPLPVLDLLLVEPLLSGAGLMVPCVARGVVSAVLAAVLAVVWREEEEEGCRRPGCWQSQHNCKA
jgi:hypothetical protein